MRVDHALRGVDVEHRQVERHVDDRDEVARLGDRIAPPARTPRAGPCRRGRARGRPVGSDAVGVNSRVPSALDRDLDCIGGGQRGRRLGQQRTAAARTTGTRTPPTTTRTSDDADDDDGDPATATRAAGSPSGRGRPAGRSSAPRRAGALGAQAGDRQVADVRDEREPALDRPDQRAGDVRAELPGLEARAALQVAVVGARQDVELLAAGRRVAVPDVAQLLEDVERPVDGRRRRVRVALAAALDQLAAGDVAVGRLEDVEDQAPLRRPAQAARAQVVADPAPQRGRVGRRGRGRSATPWRAS